MKYLPDSENIFCSGCQCWYKLRQDAFIPGDHLDLTEIICLECGTVLGYTWEIPEIFLPEYIPGRNK